MKKTLYETLTEKYGDEYNIEEIDDFTSYSIAEIETEEGGEIYKLIIKKVNGDCITTWHTTADTVLLQILNYSL